MHHRNDMCIKQPNIILLSYEIIHFINIVSHEIIKRTYNIDYNPNNKHHRREAMKHVIVLIRCIVIFSNMRNMNLRQILSSVVQVAHTYFVMGQQ